MVAIIAAVFLGSIIGSAIQNIAKVERRTRSKK